MIAKKHLYRVALFGLGSLICFGLTAPMALASSTPELSNNTQQEDTQQEDGPDTLRQGLPGRRLGGGTRSVRSLNGGCDYLTVDVMSN